MMLTGMQGVTPDVVRAMRRIEGAGRRVGRHALDDVPPVAVAAHANFVFCSGDVSPVAVDKTDRRYAVVKVPKFVTAKPRAAKAQSKPGPRPTKQRAAEAVLLANPTMSISEVAARAKCSKQTASVVCHQLVAAKRIAPPQRSAPGREALIKAIKADGTLSTKQYAALAGVTTRCVTAYIKQMRLEGRVVRLLSIVDVDHA